MTRLHSRDPRTTACRPHVAIPRSIDLAVIGLALASLALASLALAAPRAFALDIAENDWAYSSELSAQGFAPFATSSVNSVYGMQRGTEIFLCFVMDTSAAQAKRQSALLAELSGTATSRTVPNIPVACVLTQ